MRWNMNRLGARGVCRSAVVAVTILTILAATKPAHAVFNGATGGISFGVAGLGAPVSPGVPTYLLNNFNGRTDILTNPGIGLTANPVVANNTSSTGTVAWGPGQFIYNIQNGGGNVNGPFGQGAAVVTGPQFAYRLADGGVPGGVSSSYEIMSWDANFTQGAAALAGTTGTYITMGGRVPLNQDLAMISLRTRIIGNTIGQIEVPGLILAVERTGPATYATVALQDTINGGAGALAMGGGWAIIIDNAATGAFRALAYNAFPDLMDGVLNGVAIPAGEVFTARVTATVYADPASIDMLDPLDFQNNDLVAQALLNGGGTPFPVNPLFTQGENVPEPATLMLALIGSLALCRRRR